MAPPDGLRPPASGNPAPRQNLLHGAVPGEVEERLLRENAALKDKLAGLKDQLAGMMGKGGDDSEGEDNGFFGGKAPAGRREVEQMLAEMEERMLRRLEGKIEASVSRLALG